jgi:hypothetical protein
MDYALAIWHNPDKIYLRSLASVQRTALLKILSAFQSSATRTLEVEAYIPPTNLRLKRRAQDTIARLYTLPKEHPMHAVLERMERRCVLKGTHAKFPLAEAAKTRDLNRPQELETIDPRPLEPWQEPFIERIDLEGDIEKTVDKIDRLTNSRSRIIYTTATEKKKQLGVAVVELNHRNEVTRSQRTSIGSKSTWSTHLAQLIAISKAVEAIGLISNEENSMAFTIVSNSRTALQTVANLPNKSGQ